MKNNPSLLFISSVLIAVFLSNCVTRDVNSDTKEFIVNYYQTLEKKEVYKFDDYYEPVLSIWFDQNNITLDDVKSKSRTYFQKWPISKHVIDFSSLNCTLNNNGTLNVSYNLDYYCSKQDAKDSLKFNIDIDLLLSDKMKIISIEDDVITRTKKEYFSEDWSKLKTSENARYYRILTLDKDDNPLGLVKDYYITGELQGTGTLVSKSMSIDSLNVWDGELKWFHKNGFLSSKTVVVDSLFEGLSFNWDENGVLLYTLKYQKGIPIQKSEFEYFEDGKLKIMSVDQNEESGVNKYQIYCDESGSCEQTFKDDFSYNSLSLDWKYSDWNVTNSMMYYSRNSNSRLNYVEIPYNNGDFKLSSFMTPKFNVNNVPFGFVYGYKDNDNYGTFTINSNTFSISHYSDGIRTIHADWIEDKSLSHVWNDNYDKKLMIQKKGDNLIFAINAYKVFTIENDYTMGDYFGYYIGSKQDSTLIAFDDFQFTQPAEYPIHFDTINNVNLLK